MPRHFHRAAAVSDPWRLPRDRAATQTFHALKFDVELPASVHPVEYGLLGVWSGRTFQSTLEAIRRFGTREGVRAYFADRTYRLGERLRGLPDRDRALETEWLSEDFWATWEVLLATISEAATNGSHLALEAWD